MKRNHSTRRALLCLLLMLSVLLSLVACRQDEPPTIEPPAAKTFVPSHAYDIILSEAHIGSTALSQATKTIRETFESVYGVKTTPKDDLVKTGQQNDTDRYEILIGETNRPQSQDALRDLGILDYTFFVESERVIVICGGSPAATVRAVGHFCSEVIGYVPRETNERTPIAVGTTYTHRESYPFSSITLNGIPLSEYAICVGRMSSLDFAFTLAEGLGSYTGTRIPVLSKRSITGEEKGLILLDFKGRDLISLSNAADCYYHVEKDSLGTVISFNGFGSSFEDLYDHFLSAIKKTEQDGTVVLTIPEEEYYGIQRELPSWTLESEQSTTLAAGLTYTEQVLYDEDGKPYRTYFLTVDPTRYEIHLGTSNDGYDCALDTANRQTTAQHVEVAVKNGKNVLAAVNAGFFDIHGDYSPSSLAVKDGIPIRVAHNQPFFAMTADGKSLIAAAGAFAQYEEGEILTAIAGSAVILKGGMLTNTATNTDIHPRTLVGIKEDGSVILAVIDGRQAAHSNGASLAQCAFWMKSLGAVTVLNLDGGGSSTLVTRNPETNEIITHNSPSDGSLRKVHNSLLIVLKEESE